MRISDWSSDVCSSDLKEFDEARFENAMRAVVGEVAEVGGSRVTVPWGVPAEVFEDRAEVLASDALQRAGLPGDGDDFGLMATSRPGRYVLLQRSEERRVGKEWCSACVYLGYSVTYKKKTRQQ